MKRFFLLLITLLFLLTGCSVGDRHTIESYQYQAVNVRTSYYEFDEPVLEIFHASDNDYIPYVNIEEFVTMMHPALIDLERRKFFNLSFVHEIEGVDEFGNNYIFDMIITIDAEDDTIHVNDINIFSILNEDRNVEYVPEYERDIIQYTPGVVSKTYHLGDYGIDIIKKNRNFYMPLYLANLFFTGDYLNIYDKNGTIYLVDDLSDDYFLVSDEELYIDENVMMEHTSNYLAFLLDNFYGFEGKKGSGYKEEMEEHGINGASTIVDQSNNIFEYITSFDDLHLTINDKGYYKDFVSTPIPSIDSRSHAFNTAFEEKMCDDVVSEVELKNMGYYYILKINEFTERTKDYLKEAFTFIGEEDIIIDLSCNLGGTVGGIFDLLAYMTNQSVTVHYFNSEANEKYTEQIKSISDKKVDNTFYVYTSPVTFSAANEFVNIVQEHDLATVFGERTLGGANTTSQTVLPNNMVLTYSTHMRFTDELFNSIEYGIEPDIFTSYDNILGSIFDLQGIPTLTYDIEITNNSTPDDITYAVNTKQSNANITEMIVEVINVSTDEVIETYTTSSFDFNYSYDISSYDNIEIRLSAVFSSTGPKFLKKISSDFVDDLADFPYDGQAATIKNISINTSKDFEFDEDYLKVEIESDTIINLKINGENTSYDLYDEDGTIILRDKYQFVTPGTYYLGLETSIFEVGPYVYEVETIDEVHPYGIYINLIEGSNSVDMIYDYETDEEIVYFNVEDKSLVEISFEPNISLETISLYENGRLLFNDDFRYSSKDSYTFLLDAGDYTLETTNTTTTEITFLVTEFLGNEPTSLIEDGSINHGVYIEGFLDLTFDAEVDQDVYTISVTDDTYLYYYQYGDHPPIVYDKDFNLLAFNTSTSGVLLPIGTNYLVFSSESLGEGTFLSVLEKEIPTINSKQDVSLNENITISNYGTETSSFYSFSITEEKEYTFTNTHNRVFSNAVYNIYDNTDTLVATFTTDSYNHTLPIGDYYIEASFTSTFLFIGELVISE